MFYQKVLVHEERVSGHRLKFLVGEVGLAVRDEVVDIVLPADRRKAADLASVSGRVCGRTM